MHRERETKDAAGVVEGLAFGGRMGAEVSVFVDLKAEVESVRM